MKRRRPGAQRHAIDELDEVFAAVARYFGLLSEPTRLKILHTICNDEHSVSEIVAATGATQTNVSRHLALLRDAGVVSRRKERNAALYKVTDRVFADVWDLDRFSNCTACFTARRDRLGEMNLRQTILPGVTCGACEG